LAAPRHTGQADISKKEEEVRYLSFPLLDKEAIYIVLIVVSSIHAWIAWIIEEFLLDLLHILFPVLSWYGMGDKGSEGT
jgi:hypothetical protein